MPDEQININVIDLIPPTNMATIDMNGYTGNTYSKEDLKVWQKDLELQIAETSTTAVKGEAIPTSSPTPYDATTYPKGLFEIWATTTAGTYLNFKLAGGIDPIEIQATDFNGYTVQIWVQNGVSSLKKIKMPEQSYSVQIGNNKLNLAAYTQLNKAIASNGNVANLTGAISIIMLPLKPNTTYTVSGFFSGSSKYMAMKDALGVTVGSVTVLNPNTPKTFTTPATETFLNIYGKTPAEGDTWDDALILNEGSVALPYEPYTEIITEINQKSLISKGLVSNNTVPTPVNPQNAVNKEYFDLKAITSDDLTVESSNNLAHPSYIIDGQYINNTGGITTAAGWRMIAIPVGHLPDGQQITLGRFTINGGGYAAFRNATNNTLTEYLGAITGATKTVVKPTGATVLYTDIKRPADDGTNYAQLTVNLGSSLLPYESPLGTITKIKNYDVVGTGGGGEAYDQSLNTTDDVEFNSINANNVIIGVMNIPLPEGAGSPPLGVDIGEWWFDTVENKVTIRTI